MPQKLPRTGAHEAENASAIALNFIAFLAADGDRLARFCALTGSDHGQLRDSLGQMDFQAMALDYALQDEALLIEFAAQSQLKPENIAAARRLLPGYAG